MEMGSSRERRCWSCGAHILDTTARRSFGRCRPCAKKGWYGRLWEVLTGTGRSVPSRRLVADDISSTDAGLVRQLIDRSGENLINRLFGAEAPFFWVDWREEDDAIASYCSVAAGCECVRAEWRGDDLYMVGHSGSRRVPLTYSIADRHITLLAINEVIAPVYEIRYVCASGGGDTAGLVVLATSEWTSLEQQYGTSAVDRAFRRLRARPNIFTEPMCP